MMPIRADSGCAEWEGYRGYLNYGEKQSCFVYEPLID